MKLGTINELGKSHVIVQVDDEFACKLNDLEKAIGNKLSNNLIEFIISAKNKELFSKLQKNINNVRKINIKDLLNDKYLLFQKGKKNYFVIKIA